MKQIHLCALRVLCGKNRAIMCQYANCLRCVPHGNWYADNYSLLEFFA